MSKPCLCELPMGECPAHPYLAPATLTDFLLARIAEDEAAARRATAGDRTGNWWIEPDEGGVSEVSCLDVQGFITAVDADVAHIALHDPARVLAECEAKRQIVEYVQIETHVLQLLALPYADHPDYREEWKP